MYAQDVCCYQNVLSEQSNVPICGKDCCCGTTPEQLARVDCAAEECRGLLAVTTVTLALEAQRNQMRSADHSSFSTPTSAFLLTLAGATAGCSCLSTSLQITFSTEDTSCTFERTTLRKPVRAARFGWRREVPVELVLQRYCRSAQSRV